VLIRCGPVEGDWPDKLRCLEAVRISKSLDLLLSGDDLTVAAATACGTLPASARVPARHAARLGRTARVLEIAGAAAVTLVRLLFLSTERT
jgi:hypothetical protein